MGYFSDRHVLTAGAYQNAEQVGISEDGEATRVRQTASAARLLLGERPLQHPGDNGDFHLE
jgi:hypothetical protein